jgi:hypothetical protein
MSIMPEALSRIWERMPRRVVVGAIVLAAPPLLIWWADHDTAVYPPSLATVVGTVLAAVVFMLTAAQRAQQDALDAIVDELTGRDERLCAVGSTDDPEPWPPQMERESVLLEEFAAIVAMKPAERRLLVSLRRRSLRVGWREDLLRTHAWFAVRDAVFPGTSGMPTAPNANRIDRYVEEGLSPGGIESLPSDLRHCLDWITVGGQYQSRRHEREELERRIDELLAGALWYSGTFPIPSFGRRPASPESARQLEDVLAGSLDALDVASLLMLAIVSLTLTGVAYTAGGISWPPSAELLASVIIVAITAVYLAYVRHAMDQARRVAAKRLQLLRLPNLRKAALLLTDRFVAEAATNRSTVAGQLERHFLAVRVCPSWRCGTAFWASTTSHTPGGNFLAIMRHPRSPTSHWRPR